MGVLSNEHETTIIKLPTMAFANPPPSEPGAGVLWVNMDKLKAEKPLNIKMLRIQSRNIKPMAMADIESTRPMKLALLRLA
jgi:hypothetical protein